MIQHWTMNAGEGEALQALGGVLIITALLVALVWIASRRL